MHIRDIRLARLTLLLAEHGNTKAALAKKLRKAPAQVSQWFNQVRTITEDSAREIEKRAEKPAGWLDLPIYPPAGNPAVVNTSDDPALVLTVEEREIILRIRQLAAKTEQQPASQAAPDVQRRKHPRAA